MRYKLFLYYRLCFLLVVTHKGAGVSAGNIDMGRKLTVLRGQLCRNAEELLGVEERKALSLRIQYVTHSTDHLEQKAT